MIVRRATRLGAFWAGCFIVLSGCGHDRTLLEPVAPEVDSLMASGSRDSSGAEAPAVPNSTENGDLDVGAPETAAEGTLDARTGVSPGVSSGAGAGASAASGAGAGAADASGAVVSPTVELPAPCGGAGQACCAEGRICQAQLGCEDGRCVECARFAAIPPPAGLSANTLSRVSGDGRVVVVNGSAGQAYRMVWRSNQAPTVLLPLAGDLQSWVTAVSRDGSVAVGGSAGPDGTHATRWASDAVATSLSALEVASGLSADGSVVIGSDANGPVRWTAQGVERIASMDSVNDVSADGRSIVGTKQSETASDRGVLDSGSAVTFVGLADALISSATLISSDGSVALGTNIDVKAQASIFRWRDGTAEPLAGLSEAHDVNADGSVVVGAASAEECGGSTAVWRQGRGTEHLECILPAGTLPERWRLLRATGVSEDGRVVSGFGINPESALQSWVAVLGPACAEP